MSASYMERLPAEVQTDILKYLPTTRALRSLIYASPRYYQVFRASRESILSEHIKNIISMEAMPQALIASSEARDPPVGLSFHEVEESLVLFNKDVLHSFSMEMKLPISNSVRLVKLNNSIIYHMEHFVGYTLQNLYVCSASISPKFTTAGIARKSISETEHIRLQRAFYRVDLFCYLFHSSDKFNHKTHKQIASKAQEAEFLSPLPPWEVEEIACVWYYVRKRLENLFDRLEDSFVKTALEGSHLGIKDALAVEDREALLKEAHDNSKKLYTSQESVNISHMDGCFFEGGANDFLRNQAKRFSHDKHIEYLASMGLAFLHRLFDADPKEQLRIVLENTCSRSEVKFLSTALNVYCNKAAQRHANWDDDGITLDEYLRPNHGFQWARTALGTSYPCRHKGGLRSLGYVFWDSPRLRGILGPKEDVP
ncbi:MAG: hypothetical protein Q9195_002610 [Heterodermia aff. obscurata]